MDESLLESGKQKKLKILSKIIYIIAKIAKILVRVGVVFVIIGALIGGFALNTINATSDGKGLEIKFGEESVKIENVDGEVKVTADNKTVDFVKIENTDDFDKVVKAFSENEKTKLMITYSTIMVSVIVIMILASQMLKNMEELFKNINKKDTPFILENVDFVRHIGALMIAMSVVSIVMDGVSSIIMKHSANISVGYSIMSILIVYCIAYVLEYGCRLQQKSENKIYGEENKTNE